MDQKLMSWIDAEWYSVIWAEWWEVSMGKADALHTFPAGWITRWEGWQVQKLTDGTNPSLHGRNIWRVGGWVSLWSLLTCFDGAWQRRSWWQLLFPGIFGTEFMRWYWFRHSRKWYYDSGKWWNHVYDGHIWDSGNALPRIHGRKHAYGLGMPDLAAIWYYMSPKMGCMVKDVYRGTRYLGWSWRHNSRQAEPVEGLSGSWVASEVL